MLYRLADSSPANSEPHQSLRGARNLLQNPVTKDRTADPPTEEKRPPLSEGEAHDHGMVTTATAEAPESRKVGKHHSSDKSLAGGGVIVGGLVTAIFAAVYCYIRVTRKHNIQNST
ncbi:hypothetical protein F511_36502 [Dorcoceras hygrometricum]|uniref:Uncharacterized protein n=1 Tax=Dorcoceras hygrometricum TaxID=472368 RepID=A0A2Z7C169_9LAMI|nr:hypothetical protein F511_36502 [Dorcoceras hygrometricum]